MNNTTGCDSIKLFNLARSASPLAGATVTAGAGAETEAGKYCLVLFVTARVRPSTASTRFPSRTKTKNGTALTFSLADTSSTASASHLAVATSGCLCRRVSKSTSIAAHGSHHDAQK